MQIKQVAGIVAEYNPFHNGHAWMIKTLREQGCDTIVCAMSGDFVQRAQAAEFDTTVRTKAALAGGVDLVLRLPTPYAIASAEAFATGAVGLLSALGCVDVLAFGTEAPNNNIGELLIIASLLQSEDFVVALREELKKGSSYAVARAVVAERMLPGAGEVLNTPNNILGIEYCKALQGPVKAFLHDLVGTDENCVNLPSPIALRRKGALHDGAPKDGIASASWLRGQCGKTKEAKYLQEWVPQPCFTIYENAIETGRQINREKEMFALLARLKAKTAKDFAPYTGKVEEGLANRLAKACFEATTLEEVYAFAKSKRFAHSRIRRAVLATALGLPVQLPVVPPFAQVLGANQKGIALLKKAKEKVLLPVGTSLAKLAKTDAISMQIAKAEEDAHSLYALCMRKASGGSGVYTQPAIFVHE